LGEILKQLDLDQTFFVQMAVFAALFFALSRIFFQPFLKLFQKRYDRTVHDKEAAAKLMSQALAKLEDYKQQLATERSAARAEYETIIASAKADEAALMSQAREEAKKITQATAESISKQREEIKAQLEKDTDDLARTISEKLLSRKL